MRILKTMYISLLKKRNYNFFKNKKLSNEIKLLYLLYELYELINKNKIIWINKISFKIFIKFCNDNFVIKIINIII